MTTLWREGELASFEDVPVTLQVSPCRLLAGKEPKPQQQDPDSATSPPLIQSLWEKQHREPLAEREEHIHPAASVQQPHERGALQAHEVREGQSWTSASECQIPEQVLWN